MKLEFWVPGLAATTRPRIGMRGKHPCMITAPEVTAYRAEVLRAYRQVASDRPPYTGLVILTIAAYGHHQDVDNIAKPIQDALNGEAFVDDRQIKFLGVLADDRELTPIRTVTRGERKGQQEGGGVARPKPGAYVGVKITLQSWDPAEQTA